MAAHELARWHIPTQTSIVLVLREDISGRERERKQHLSQSHEPSGVSYHFNDTVDLFLQQFLLKKKKTIVA
jgi:hypothetical protein